MKRVLTLFDSKKNWVVVLLSTILICPFVLFDLPYYALFSDEPSDFNFSDLYARIADKTSLSSYSRDVKIVTLDGCQRSSISSIIDSLDMYGASVIGIDIIFKTEFEYDSLLINSINNAKAKIVLAARLDKKNEIDENPIFKISDRPYFESLINIPILGAVNFATNSIHGAVRSFKPSFYLGDDGGRISINQFSVEIVKQFKSSAFDTLMYRKDQEVESIKFHKNNIDEYTWEEISNIRGDDIKGKIVLLGYAKDMNDLKKTPIADGMPGILIHAKAIQTILNGDYMTKSSNVLNKVNALIISFAFIWCLLALTKFPNTGKLIVRIIQFFILFIILFIGVIVFINQNHYIDMFYTILCIGLSQASFDVIRGLVAIYLRIKNNKYEKNNNDL